MVDEQPLYHSGHPDRGLSMDCLDCVLPVKSAEKAEQENRTEKEISPIFALHQNPLRIRVTLSRVYEKENGKIRYFLPVLIEKNQEAYNNYHP